MMLYDNIKSVHIEPTQKCQAACLQCDRNQNGGNDNPYLSGAELTIGDYTTIFSEDFVRQLNSIYMCGNLGDPCISIDSIYALEYFRFTNPSIYLSINTNGGARDITWWRKLALILGKKGHVTFSFDGLEDTNHIYRQNVNWKKCINNSKAFIDAGGRARWEFIVFKHNQHQIEQAKLLAKSMGFEDFRTKKTGRFIDASKTKSKDVHYGVDKKGNSKLLEKPDKEYINNSLNNQTNVESLYGSMDDYYDKTNINCKAINKQEIFVTSEGHIFPCCWTAGQQYKWYLKPKESPIWNIIDSVGGVDIINAKYNSIKDIVNGPFFKKIQQSWSCSSVKDGRLLVCAHKCGEHFDPYKDQWL